MSTTGKPYQTFQLKPSDSYITFSLLKNILSSSTAKNAVLEETSSELWYETLNGPGKIVFKNNITYEGNIKYGLLNSTDENHPSILNFPDGTQYVGTVKNNRITGGGKYTFKNGDTYEGQVVNGLRNGYGIFKSTNNIIYEGEWKNGLKHGKGKIIQGNMELEGEWENGIICGKCRIKWKSGNIFEGDLNNNKMEGNGYMIWYNKNEKYIGQWKNNIQNGFGIHIYYNDCLNNNHENKYFRNRYIGQYKDGKKNGYGKMFYNNGCIYEGYWKNNKKEGFGIFFYFDKTKYIGNFQNDIMVDSNISSNENKDKVKNNNLYLAKSSKKINTKKERINKNIDEIKIPLFLDDIINNEPDIKQYLKPIDNLLLRNLSLITHIYLVSCGKEDIKLSDIGMSTVISESRSTFKQSTSQKINSNQNIQDQKTLSTERKNGNNSNNSNNNNNEQGQNEEKKEIDFDNIYSNDFSFCLTLKNLWKLIRDCGLISPEFNLAQINRIIYQNKDNYIDMFYIPILFEKNNKNREQFDNIYEYLFQKMSKAKNDFDNKYKKLIEISSENNDSEYKSKNIYEDDFNYHEEKNIILLRYFYEILIRIAYIKYPEENWENRVKILIDILKTYFKSKRKSGIDLSESMINFLDSKIKNPMKTIDSYINNNYILLLNLFNELYLYSCDNEKCTKIYDKTITYRFFYENIILNSEILSKIFENKMHYIDLITLFYKERKITSTNIDTIDLPEFEIVLYIESVLDTEMIFYEFCELIFFISRKYFQYNGITLEEEEPKRPRDSVKKKKTRRVKKDEEEKETSDLNDNNNLKSSKGLHLIEEKLKSEDYYLQVINEIYKAKETFIKKNQSENGNINKFFYPILKTHTIIENLREQERLRKLEEERIEQDRIRYNLERKAFKDEDINIYKEENEENAESEENSDY